MYYQPQQASTIICFRTRKIVTILSKTIVTNRLENIKHFVCWDDFGNEFTLNSCLRVWWYEHTHNMWSTICYELECVIDEEITISALKSGLWLKSIS